MQLSVTAPHSSGVQCSVYEFNAVSALQSSVVEYSEQQWSGVEKGRVVFYSEEECSEMYDCAVECSKVQCCGMFFEEYS